MCRGSWRHSTSGVCPLTATLGAQASSSRTARQLTSTAAAAEDDLYSRIIADGIPRTSTARNVAVVGAGVSGLVAATLLARPGTT